MKTKHDIEQLKIIRDDYAIDVGYASFAKMASSVNIVPRDITEIAKAYAEHMLGQYTTRAQALVDALEKIQKWCNDAGLKEVQTDNPIHMAIYHSLHEANTALQSWNQKEGV